jgi:glycosyltransferase involved in cell wall biosynthesis
MTTKDSQKAKVASDNLNYNSVTIVLPSYQKRDSIMETMLRIEEVIDPFKKIYNFEYIVVIDGDDGSESVLQELFIEGLRTITNVQNMGKGFSLKRGFKEANSQYVVFFDMDLDIHPRVILEQVELLRDNSNFVGVAGSKVHKDSTVNYPFRRKVYSYAFRILVKVLFGENIEDSQTGVKTFRRKLIQDEVDCSHENGFIFELELLLRLARNGKLITYSSVSIDHQFNSTIGIETIWQILRQVLKIRFKS